MKCLQVALYSVGEEQMLLSEVGNGTAHLLSPPPLSTVLGVLQGQVAGKINKSHPGWKGRSHVTFSQML